MRALRRIYRGENEIDFARWWKRGLTLSAVLIVISLLSLFTRGLNLGIDFEGGVSIEGKAPGVSVSQAQGAMDNLGVGAAKVQVIGTDTLRVQVTSDQEPKRDDIRQALADLAGTQASDFSVSTVGPSWGQEITHSAERALVFFLLAILLYLSIRLEWKMALGAVLAMIHDVIISVGVYSVLQLEVTPPTVIAFLTILGYSIYDTIVVFDKVKENQARPPIATRLTYTELSSLSMNEVLLRSINTSIVAILPVISMLMVGAGILGAVTLEEFSIALLVGMLSGAYSSIFVAMPIVVWLKEREPRNAALRERLASGKGGSLSRSQAEALSLSGSPSSTLVAGSPAKAPSTGATTTLARGGTSPTAPTTTAIPPRPRKKGKRR
jgi:preprotein translocase subunit SecF